jgi:sulfate permease, SulP family
MNTLASPGADRVRARQILAGSVGSLAALALMISQALLAHAPMGPSAVATGMAATAVTCGVAGVGFALLSRTRLPAAGPSMTTALILSSLIGALIPSADGAWVLAVAGLTVSLAGLIQLLGAMAGLAQIVRLVPRPVLAGFINGVALLMITSQLPLLIGQPLGTEAQAWLSSPWQWGAVVLGLATITGIVWLDRLRPDLPSTLVVLVLGALLYAALRSIWPDGPLGPTVGPVPPALPHPLVLAPVFSTEGWTRLLSHGDTVLGTAVVLALIGSLESALNLQAVDQLMQERHDPRRELALVGAMNIVCGLLAGLPAVAQLARASAIHRAGGRGRLATGTGALVLMATFVAAAPLVAPLPLAVLGGIVIVIAWNMLDRWTLSLLAPWRRTTQAAGLRGGLVVMAVVLGLTLWRGFAAGVGAGVLLSMAILIARMNQSPLRASSSAEQRPSRRAYPAALAERLQDLRRHAAVWELEGALFFGNADRVVGLADTVAAGTRVVVVELRRVTFVDESGAAALALLGRTLQRRGTRLLLAGLAPGSAQALASIAAELPLWPNADAAVEQAERLLLGDDVDRLLGTAPMEASALLKGLTPEQLTVVQGLMKPVTLQAGERLFNQGDPSDGLYELTQGSVSIVIGSGETRQRLLSLSAGMPLGEAGWLDGGPRSAHAEADLPSLLHHLDARALQQLSVRHPAIAAQLHLNIAVFLSGRLRSVRVAQ